jgi:small conductance mechanosensitive channel
MDNFLSDIFQHIKGYYQSLVDLTPKLLLAIVIVLISWLIASRVQSFSAQKLKQKMHDPLLASFIANLIKALLIIIGLLFMFRVIGLTGVAQSILAGAGISAFIIGFALKDIGENFLAGILLAFKRPFSVGDIIESNGVKGKVAALNLRDTQIKSDSKNIYIPNALLIKNTLINFNSDGYLLQDFTIGIDFGSDYIKAIEVIIAVLKKDTDVVDKEYKNSAMVSGIIGAVVQINIRYWIKTDVLINDYQHRSDIIIKVTDALKSAGIAIK